MKLSQNILKTYRGPAKLPNYDRGSVTPGILHIGVGAFHRAHQAAFVDDLLNHAPRWGIVGVSLRTSHACQALAPQDGLYVLGTRQPEALTTQIIGSILSVEHGREAAIAAMADPQISLVTLTATEKSYRDSIAPNLLGAVLAEGLNRRFARRGGPLTILSCDNLSENGARTEALVRSQASEQHTHLQRALDHDIAFPNCMVDRITPAITEDDRAMVRDLTGLDDAWPVITEPFRQWVIEDRFVGERPPLEKAGVEFVTDIHPYENMKLRLLNGAHTIMASLGQLLGHTYVYDAVSDLSLRALLDATANREIMPHLALPAIKAEAYWRVLLDRFANPSLRHSLDQIASDSSQKLPIRLIAPAVARLLKGQDCAGLALAIAGWIAFVRKSAVENRPWNDPLRQELYAMAHLSPMEMVQRLSLDDYPLAELSEFPKFQNQIAATVENLESSGANETIKAYLASR